jgi:hypothetical protein
MSLLDFPLIDSNHMHDSLNQLINLYNSKRIRIPNSN